MYCVAAHKAQLTKSSLSGVFTGQASLKPDITVYRQGGKAVSPCEQDFWSISWLIHQVRSEIHSCLKKGQGLAQPLMRLFKFAT